MAVLGVCWITQVPEESIRDGLACGGVLLQEGSQATSTQPLQVEQAAAAAAAEVIAEVNSNQQWQGVSARCKCTCLRRCLLQQHCYMQLVAPPGGRAVRS
jgi:hypothetical protein